MYYTMPYDEPATRKMGVCTSRAHVCRCIHDSLCLCICAAVHIPSYLPTNIHKIQYIRLPTYPHTTYLYICLPTYPHTDTHMPTCPYMPTCLHAYMPARLKCLTLHTYKAPACDICLRDALPSSRHIPVSVKKHSSGEKQMWPDKLSECQIRGRIAVCAAVLQSKGLSTFKGVFFHRHRYRIGDLVRE